MRLAILGNGFLSGIVVDAWEKGMLPEYEIVGILGRSKDKTMALAERAKAKACFTLEELLDEQPEIVAEAASVEAVRSYAPSLLEQGISMAVLSIGAFADEVFYEQVKILAKEHGAKIHIASGAIGGFDVLRTIALMDAAQVTFHTRKGPHSLKNTPIYQEILQEKEKDAFTGSAKEAIALLPTKVNVAVAAALATIGPEKEQVKITSEPGYVGDRHCITAEIEGVKAVIDVYSATSAIAGYSLVALLQNLVSPIQFA